MTTQSYLIERIEAFLDRHEMTWRALSLATVGNHHLRRRLLDGRLTIRTIGQVEAHMREVDSGAEAAGQADQAPVEAA